MYSVTIKFEIDEDTLEAAINNLLIYGKKITKTALIEEIKKKIADLGYSIIRFPEYWGMEKKHELTQKYLDMMKPKFNLT